MKRTILCISALVSVVLLTAGLPDAGQAGTLKNPVRTSGGPVVSKNTVIVTGTISGSLQGRIQPGGRNVEITDQTRIYKNGKGSIEKGTYVAKAPVYVVGVKRDGKIYAVMIIVSDSRTDARGGEVRKLGPDEQL